MDEESKEQRAGRYGSDLTRSLCYTFLTMHPDTSSAEYLLCHASVKMRRGRQFKLLLEPAGVSTGSTYDVLYCTLPPA